MNEKQILLKGIQQLMLEMTRNEITCDLLERYNTLVGCLIDLNWKECGSRSGEKNHINAETLEQHRRLLE